MRPPSPDRFWGSGPPEDARWLLFGAPLDLTGSGRLGTGRAPSAIRRASHNIESYSPILRADLFDAGLADLGDLELDGLDVQPALARVQQTAGEILERGRPLIVGGEHTITLAAARAVLRRYPDALILALDAHLDLADELDGRRLAHGTWAARLVDEFGPACLALLGVRSGTRPEWERARRGTWVSPDLAVPDGLRRQLTTRPLYLSIDIDVVDPAAAPGTGCPEPGGPTSRELLDFLQTLRVADLVGLDVTEVLPDVDPAAITATLAAKLIRESVLLFE